MAISGDLARPPRSTGLWIPPGIRRLGTHLLCLCASLLLLLSNPAAAQRSAANDPALQIGVGDTVNVQVYGRPELSTTTYIADDGTLTIPLAGPVKVAGLSPNEAAKKVAKALQDGQYLVNPQVTIVLTQFRSQLVSVLGEVHTPGRYPIESKTNVLDLLAQAGGTTENASDVIYLLRPDKSGQIKRYPIDLRGLGEPGKSVPTLRLAGGDSLYIPRAPQFYIYGEVKAPNMYRLEPNMTLVQAISRGGGITERGSDSRIEIRRRTADGGFKTISPHLNDLVQPNDVILVKERLF